jgi:A/G-specific adenine glycosylase
MLQQTRVAVVVGYFKRFLNRFPTVRELASANENEVLTLWSGLGYYRRARMLYRAAKVVVAEHGGKLPGDSESLRKLPGIGRYTASAIASIAFNEPVAVVDGNVERVLERVHGRALPGKEHWRIAQELIPEKRPGDFNQAMMELGATVCTPATPYCGECPVRGFCSAKQALRREAQERRYRKEVSYVLDQKNGSVKLVKRSAHERLMPSMFELPEAKSGGEAEFRLKHSITHTDYDVLVRRAKSRRGRYVRTSELHELPLTGLTRKILRRTGLMS